jgi:hypothetical protein
MPPTTAKRANSPSTTLATVCLRNQLPGLGPLGVQPPPPWTGVHWVTAPPGAPSDYWGDRELPECAARREHTSADGSLLPLVESRPRPPHWRARTRRSPPACRSTASRKAPGSTPRSAAIATSFRCKRGSRLDSRGQAGLQPAPRQPSGRPWSATFGNASRRPGSGYVRCVRPWSRHPPPSGGPARSCRDRIQGSGHRDLNTGCGRRR